MLFCAKKEKNYNGAKLKIVSGLMAYKIIFQADIRVIDESYMCLDIQGIPGKFSPKTDVGQ